MSELTCNTVKWFSKNLLSIEINKTKEEMKKKIYLGLSILVINKTVMHEFWYNYLKPKYQGKVNMLYE